MQDPTDVVGRRIVAYIIDTIILLVVVGVAFFALAESDPFAFGGDAGDRIGRAFGEADPDTDFDGAWSFSEAVGGFIGVDEDEFEITVRIVEGGAFWAVNGIGLAAALGLLVLLQGASGKTPGKAMLGLTTVAADGSPPGIGRAALRYLVLFVDAGLLFLPGLIAALASKGHRRLGDMAAGTYVVRSAAAGQPVVLDGPGAAAPPPAYATTATPPDAQWDAARGAWIRWDGSQWVQHDPATGSWRPIS